MTRERHITAVAFDIGGVLLDWDPRYLYRKLIADPAELEQFLGQICTPHWHRAHDLGADTEQSCRELAHLHPDHADLIMAWTDPGEEMVAGQFDATVAVLADVRATGTRCLALSNMEPDKYLRRRAMFPFFGMFDGCVISGIERVAKPEREIFEILLSRYDLDPRATAFVDDNARNVAAARELGMIALRYSTAAQLRRDLRRLGVAIGPDGTGRLLWAGSRFDLGHEEERLAVPIDARAGVADERVEPPVAVGDLQTPVEPGRSQAASAERNRLPPGHQQPRPRGSAEARAGVSALQNVEAAPVDGGEHPAVPAPRHHLDDRGSPCRGRLRLRRGHSGDPRRQAASEHD